MATDTYFPLFPLRHDDNPHFGSRVLSPFGFFYNHIWFLSDDDDYEFSAGDLTSYENTLERGTFLTKQGVDSHIFRRGLEVRALLPVNPAPYIPYLLARPKKRITHPP